ncbi:MAG: tetratricopeptide repeat protein, partial [Candidatus Fermentibacteria bacterium]
SALLLALFTGLLLASIPCKFTLLKGARRYGLAAIIVLIAVLLGAVAIPHYLNAMRSGRELFRGKDMYLVHIQSGIDNALNAAQDWQNTGNPDAADRALYYYDSAVQAADSSIAWCEKCVETNHAELGGWYALGSAYISASHLHQRISPPMTNILRMNGRVAEDPQESERYLTLGLAAYDSLIAIAPDYAELHNNLALVWLNLGHPDRALEELRAAWDLHAHNRAAYAAKVDILNTLVQSRDGVYLHWQMTLQMVDKLVSVNDERERRTELLKMLMFDYGTTFLRYRDSADSLRVELVSILNSDYPDIASELDLYTRMQIEEMQNSLNVLQEFENGDTAAARTYLSGFTPAQLEILPVHRALNARIQIAEGDIEGMYTVIDILNSFRSADFDDLTAWPMDVSQMIDDLIEALLSSGLNDRDEREMYLSCESILLGLDRRMFEIIVFIESSPSIREASAFISDDLETLWKDIGGPLYCFMRMRDEFTGAPIMLEESLFHDSYSGILGIEEQDSLNAESVKLEIQWLYVLFCSSYNGIPHYSLVQGARTVSLIGDAREKLVNIIGESETQYQIASMLNDLSDNPIIQIGDESSNYIEALRSDLIMGRITQPDLP